MPGLTAGHLPAQGLRVLRGALERARACCWPSRACTRRVPLFLVEGIKRRLGDAARAQGRRARAGVQARHRRRARLALAQADPPARARAGRRRRPRPASSPTPTPASTRRSPAPTSSSSPPTTRSSRRPEALRRDRRPRRAATAWSWTRGTRSAPRRCSPTRARSRALPARDEPRPRHRRRRHDRRGGRPPPARATPTSRSASPTSARRRRGCARAARSTPATCASSTEAREAIARLHARDPPGGDRRRDRQLPQAPAHADRGQQRALQRASSARRWTQRRRALRRTSARRWCSSAPTRVPDDRGATCRDCPAPRSAYGFSKLTGEVYCRAAHDEHGLPYTICRPVQRLRPGRDARRRARASPTPCPT